MKPESLVMAYQIDAVNTFPGLVHNARHITKVSCTRSSPANRKEEGAHVMADDGCEYVTSIPNEILRLNHLLYKYSGKRSCAGVQVMFPKLRKLSRASGVIA